MSIDPEIKVLPVYQILIGFVRLVAVFFCVLSLSMAGTTLIDSALSSGFDLNLLLKELNQPWFWGQFISFFGVALFLWCFARPVALLCTPKINLRYCQVCGYNLNGDTEKPCPECGKVPQVFTRHTSDESDES